MRQKIYLKILYILLPPILTSAAMWNILIHPGALGHNWDHSIIFHNYSLKYLFKTAFSTWKEYGLGYPDNILFIRQVEYVLGLLGNAGLSGGNISKIVVFAILCGSIFSMSSLVFWLLKKNKEFLRVTPITQRTIALICGIAYALSPPVFGNIIGGSIMQFSTLPFLPLMVKYAFKVTTKNGGKTKEAIWLALLLMLIISSTHNFMLSMFFLILCFFMNPSLTTLKKLGLTFLVFSGLSAFWISALPFGAENLGSIAQQIDLKSSAESIFRTSSLFFNTFFIAGYWNRNFFLQAHPMSIVYYACAAALYVFLIFSLLIIKKGSWSRDERFFFILFLFSLGIAGLGKGPFWLLLKPLYENIIAMQLYRSSQRLLTPLNLTFCIFLGYAMARLILKTKCSRLLLSAFIIIVLVRAIPFWSGNFGREELIKANVGVMDNYRIPPSQTEALLQARQDLRFGRILYLPASISPIYLKSNYQIKAQGGDPLLLFSPDPAITSFPHESVYPIWRKLIEEVYLRKNPDAAITMARYFSAKYILYRKDIEHHYSDVSLKPAWKRFAALPYPLKNQNGLKLISRDRYHELYRTVDFLPIIRPLTGEVNVISSPDNVTDKTVDLLSDQIILLPSSKEIKTALTFLNAEKALSSGFQNMPIIEFKRESPTRFRVRAHRIDSAFTLLLNETFHRGWKLFFLPLVNGKHKKNSYGDSSISRYKVLEDNYFAQASPQELREYLKQGLVTELGDGKKSERFLRSSDKNGFDPVKMSENYFIGFISKVFAGSIQNDNLPIASKYLNNNPVIMSLHTKWDGNNPYAPAAWKDLPNESTFPAIRFPEKLHWQINGFANGWRISPKLVQLLPQAKKGEGYWYRNNDGSIEVDFLLEYTPQQYVEKGIFISLITLFICIAYLTFNYIKRY